MQIKKMFGLLMISSMVFTAACSNGANSNNVEPTVKPTNAPAATATEAPDPLAEKLSISYMGAGGGVIPPKDGPGVALINERYNIDYDVSMVPAGDYAAKLGTAIASGAMTDIMGWQGANYAELAKQGAFLALDDYIEQYPSLKVVPDYVWDGLRVDGKIYAIPRYYPVQYGNTLIIRKDWLDNLGLSMPTNYEELKEVALAFSTQDPDGNNENDTYGLMMQAGIAPDYGIGAYYKPDSWYHKNDAGQYIPNLISDANKEVMMFLAELQAAEALSPDWPVTNFRDAKKAFFSGKAGVYQQSPYDVGPASFTTLRELYPEAEIAAIPPFVQPDGEQGYMGQAGWYGSFVLNGELKDEPEKAERILMMLDDMRTFLTADESTPDNELYDWKHGKKDVGYTYENNVISYEWGKGMMPIEYLEDRVWAPNDEANDVTNSPSVTDPLQKSTIASLEQMHKDTKIYINPVNRISSPEFAANFWPLYTEFTTEVTKMIFGQRSFDDWDDIVATYLKNGGTDMINEVNVELDKYNIVGEFK